MLDHIATVCCLVHNSSHHPEQQQHFVVHYLIGEHLQQDSSYKGFPRCAPLMAIRKICLPSLYNLIEFPSIDQIQLWLFLPIYRIELCYYLSDKFVLNRGMFPFDLAFFCTTHVTSRKGNFLKLFYLQSQ